MGVPLIANQNLLGLVAVAAYKPGYFNQKDLEMIQSIALQASLAIDNARNHTAVLEQSRQDSLTGALNHGTFITMLQDELDKSKANSHSVAVIMLDVDSFKNYNDTWGHLVGDQVLTTLTNVIQEHVKNTDLVGRWGGEEFAIALPKASLTQAVRIAERIRHSMQEIDLLAEGNGKLPCPTISQGIAVFPRDANSAFELIDTADKRLYCAKQKGRNQIYSEKAA
jgi:diguanylate cyclase (GGDEF)-like protein